MSEQSLVIKPSYFMPYPEKVLLVLRALRPLLLPHWGKVAVINKKDWHAASVVTGLDIEVERFVASELKRIYPEIAFVGEENGGERTAQKFWLLDPIDGTGHFVRGLPFCTTILALIEKGEVIFGAIYDFINDKIYWAQKGQGAFCEGKKLWVSGRVLADAYISWETHLDKPENLKILTKLRGQVILFKSLSSGWEFAMIAEGKLDGQVNFNPYGQDYDFAAGALLVKEAGGIVANLGSRRYDFRNVNFIAANPKVFTALTQGKEAIFPIKE